MGQNVPPIRTSKVIADQFNIEEKTVRRAAEYSEALDKITANTGISRSAILTKQIYGTQLDKKALAAHDADYQRKVIAQILERNYNIVAAKRGVDWEEMFCCLHCRQQVSFL